MNVKLSKRQHVKLAKMATSQLNIELDNFEVLE